MALGVFVIANDIIAPSVALTDIEREVDVAVSTVQWVIHALALMGVVVSVVSVSGTLARAPGLTSRAGQGAAGAVTDTTFSRP